MICNTRLVQFIFQIKNGTLHPSQDVENRNRAIRVVKDALVEIQVGLYHPISEDTAKEIIKEIISALIVNQLSYESLQIKAAKSRFESVLHGIPSINSKFFVELTLQCEWIPLIIEVRLSSDHISSP